MGEGAGEHSGYCLSSVEFFWRIVSVFNTTSYHPAILLSILVLTHLYPSLYDYGSAVHDASLSALHLASTPRCFCLKCRNKLSLLPYTSPDFWQLAQKQGCDSPPYMSLCVPFSWRRRSRSRPQVYLQPRTGQGIALA
jgi:hypothetical protein